MSRYMKYEEVKSIRLEYDDLNKLDKEIVLEDTYEYVKIELVRGFGEVAVWINDCKEDDYIYLDNHVKTIELAEIAVKKIKFKQLKDTYADNMIQIILMK